jgi:hypothetical protein
MTVRLLPRFQPAGLLLGLGMWLLTNHGPGQSLPLGQQGNGEKEEDEGLPAMEMLVEGSILKKVIIPQYDEKLRLSSVLRADQLELEDKKTIKATKARIEFFRPDQKLRGTIDLAFATLHDQRFLRSSDPVEVNSDDLNSKGTGVVYDLKRSRGFLYGPTVTDIFLKQTTAMNFPNTPKIGFAGATMMAAAAIHAAEIQPFTEQQLRGLDRLAESREEGFLIAAAATEQKVDETEAEAAKADKTLESFLEEAAIDLPKGKPVDLTSEVPRPGEDADLKKPASIQAKDGFYFDSEAGIIVFLKEVSVDHPEFTLTGADEVKVFMEKNAPEKPNQPKPDPANKDKDGKAEEEIFGGAEFGDPSRIVATGAVVVKRKTPNPGDKKAQASGREMIMDLKTDDLIIRGGRPWILSDTANGYVADPNGYIRINLKTGDASFVGDSRGFVETDKPKP